MGDALGRAPCPRARDDANRNARRRRAARPAYAAGKEIADNNEMRPTVKRALKEILWFCLAERRAPGAEALTLDELRCATLWCFYARGTIENGLSESHVGANLNEKLFVGDLWNVFRVERSF